MRPPPLWRRYQRLLGPDVNGDVEDELRFHLEMRARDLERRGMDPAAARAEAERRFGDIRRVRGECEEVGRGMVRRESRRSRWESALQDLRLAARALRRSPGFSAVVILTLALGIGANTAIFTVVRGVLLRPLPYAASAQLVRLSNSWEGSPVAGFSPAEYFDYRDRLQGLGSMGVYATGAENLTGDGAPERLDVGFLSAGTIPTLGVAPALGRTFTADEDAPGSEAVVLLSHSLWLRRFGGDPSVIGRRITLSDVPTTVLGVMPADFRLPIELETGEPLHLYLPLGIDRATIADRGSHFLEAVGRLAPGVTVEQASAEIAGVAAEFARDYPDDYPAEMRFSAGAAPLRQAMVGDVRPTLVMLLAAVGLVLLIACANVANLVLTRAEGRRREMAVRTAIGAGRGRLVRQVLLESWLLAMAGGAAGVLLAVLMTRVLPHFSPQDLPRLEEVHVDGWVLAFAAGVSCLSVPLFGLAPALYGTRIQPQETLREGGRGHSGGRSRRRFRTALIAAQMALSVVLLIAAGLLVRSLTEIYQVDPGFEPEGVLTFRVSTPSADYQDAGSVVAFFRELRTRLEALPGVERAGAVTNLPLGSTLGDLNFQIEGRPVGDGEVSPRGDWQVVTPGYFDAVGMRLERGRGIEPRDDSTSSGVVVVNDALAELYWRGESPIGARLLLGGGAGPGWVTVVGVVGDVRHAGLNLPPRPEMYLAHAQFRFWNGGGVARSLSLVLRTTGDPLALAGPAREALRAIDPDVPAAEMQTLAQIRSESVSQPRFLSLLIGLFSALALGLSALGIYATLAHLVSQRRREIGVRMALGAGVSEITRLVVRQGLTVVMVGIVAGLAISPLLVRLLGHLLYGVSSADPVSFAVAPVLLGVVALAACYLPAHRATRVHPAEALRSE